MSRLSGFIFDVGDVIYDATPWRRWLAERLAVYGVVGGYEELVVRWERLLVDVYLGRCEYWPRFRDLAMDCGAPAPDLEVLEAEARAKAREVKLTRRPFPGVPETLSELRRRGVALVALSDSESTAVTIRKSLDELSVGSYFSHVISSRDIGSVKPERAAFAAAVAALGLPAACCGFVGHDCDELAGAMGFGLTAIAFNHDKAARAHVYLNDFDGLLALAADGGADASGQ